MRRSHVAAAAVVLVAAGAPLLGVPRPLQAQAAPLLSVDATSVLGPADWLSSGFLHGDATDPARSQACARSSGAPRSVPAWSRATTPPRASTARG